MPQLPAVRFARYQRVHGVSADDARTLISDRPLADYFEAAVEAHPGQSSGRMIATWILNELLGALKAGGTTVAASPVTPGFLSELVGLVEDGTISGKIAKDVFAECYRTRESPRAIVERSGLQQISDEALLGPIIDRVVAANPKQVGAFQSGKDGLFGFFVGAVMKETNGRANPVVATELLHKRLGR